MIADSRSFMLTNANSTTFPGLAVVFIGVAFSILGDGLADYLRPCTVEHRLLLLHIQD